MSLTEDLRQLRDPWDSDPEGEDDGFDPETGRLVISLPLPPPDNLCHRHGSFGSYATKPYRDWLCTAAHRLRELLGLWPADTGQWWGVEVSLWMGGRSDGANHLKPLLDLLGGSYVPEEGTRDPRSGNLVDRQKVQKTDRGLYRNDKRVRWALPNVIAVHCERPRCVAAAFPVPAPRDERAEAEAAVRDAKERLRQAAFDERETRDEILVARLIAMHVRDKIPGKVMKVVTETEFVSEGTVRSAWRAYKARVAA